MDNISEINLGPMPMSDFLKPLRMTFKQNGKQRFWDFVKVHDSVCSVLFNRKREVLVFVKQFRPAVFHGNSVSHNGDNNSDQDIDWTKVPPSNGITIELCAGIIDDGLLTQTEIMKKEVLEECGYEVPIENFERIIGYKGGIGSSGSTNYIFYAEITDEMKIHEGGGLAHEGEYIDVIEMTIPEVKKYISQDKVESPGGFLFAIMWFLVNKAPK